MHRCTTFLSEDFVTILRTWMAKWRILSKVVSEGNEATLRIDEKLDWKNYFVHVRLQVSGECQFSICLHWLSEETYIKWPTGHPIPSVDLHLYEYLWSDTSVESVESVLRICTSPSHIPSHLINTACTFSSLPVTFIPISRSGNMLYPRIPALSAYTQLNCLSLHPQG